MESFKVIDNIMVVGEDEAVRVVEITDGELFNHCKQNFETLAQQEAEYQAKRYQRDRAAEYPSFADQFDTLYHGGYDAWKAQIDAIKAKYPKP